MTRAPSNPLLHTYWLFSHPDGNAFYSHQKSGKWCLQLAPEAVDAAWARIDELVVAGQLRAAMVSTLWGSKERGFDTHVICVFTDDYEDLEEARRVRQLLLDEGYETTMGYKRDIDTTNPVLGAAEFIYSDSDILG